RCSLERSITAHLMLNRFKLRANQSLKFLKPRGRHMFFLIYHDSCLCASDRTIAQAIPTFSERIWLCIGMVMQASAALWTKPGAPALSDPASRISLALNLKLT